MNDAIEWAKHVGALVKDHVTRAFASLDERLKAIEARPAPVDGAPGLDGAHGAPGEPGRDGKDAPAPTPEQLQPLVAEYLAANPPAAGRDGTDGRDAPAITDEQLERAVGAYLAAHPVPAGRDGRDGQPGVAGEKGLDGAAGRDGKDAFDLDDVDLTLDPDGRTVRLRFVRGDQVREKSVTLAVPVDRGVFKAGESYAKGDCVSWGGSLFIAQTETQAQPETGTDWRLAVKRGRDGARGKDSTHKAAEPYRSRM